MLGRGKPCHVLDKSEDRLVHAFVTEHIHTFLHIGQSHVLRSADDHGSFQRDVVHEADVYVTGSRRHVDQQEVQLAPPHLQNHLLQGVAGHRAAPDQCLLGLREIADRHPLDAIFLQRHDDLLFSLLECIRHLTFRCRHLRNGRTIYVCISKAHLVAESCERYCKVDCNGRLSYATLSGSDADDVLHACHFLESEVEARFLFRC